MNELKVQESITVKEGRIWELWSRYHMIVAKNQGSWCSLFGTDGHKRRMAHSEKLAKHAHVMIRRHSRKNGLYWKHWTVVRCGSNKLLDVQGCRHQWYEIIRTEGE